MQREAIIGQRDSVLLREAAQHADRSAPPSSTAPDLAPQRKRPSVSEGALYAVASTWRFSIGQGIAILFASVISGIGYYSYLQGSLGPISAFVAIGVLTAVLYGGAMRQVDVSRRLRRPASREALRDATLVWLGVVLLITFSAFALKAGATLSRGMMLSFFVLGYFSILTSRRFLPPLIAGSKEQAEIANVIVIAARGRASTDTLMDQLLASGCPSPSYIELAADCSDADWHAELPASLGVIFSKARENGFGDICINADGFSAMQMRDLSEALQVVPRGVRIIPAPQIEALLHLPIRSIGELYSVELQRVPMGPSQRAIKRVLDLVIAIPALIFLSPLLLTVAALIKFDSKGPVLFKQRRLGYRGESFRIFKFRTMTTLDDGAVVKQATKNDMRVTRIGAFLRKSSLDELPQLLNVVLGEMSLVGPRPHALAHDDYYAKCVPHYEVRQHVKPGITGWAQVNGARGETETHEQMRKRVELDLWYAKNANVLLDTRILFLTAGALLTHRNVY